MTGAIGPRDFVESLISHHSSYNGEKVSQGSVYQVARIVGPGHCTMCDAMTPGLQLVGQAPTVRVAGWDVPASWCINHFKPWPGPAERITREESVKQPETV